MKVTILKTGLVLGSLKGAPAVHCNFPLLSFSLYTTFKTGIAAACKPIPHWNRGALVNGVISLSELPPRWTHVIVK